MSENECTKKLSCKCLEEQGMCMFYKNACEQIHSEMTSQKVESKTEWISEPVIDSVYCRCMNSNLNPINGKLICEKCNKEFQTA